MPESKSTQSSFRGLGTRVSRLALLAGAVLSPLAAPAQVVSQPTTTTPGSTTNTNSNFRNNPNPLGSNNRTSTGSRTGTRSTGSSRRTSSRDRSRGTTRTTGRESRSKTKEKGKTATPEKAVESGRATLQAASNIAQQIRSKNSKGGGGSKGGGTQKQPVQFPLLQINPVITQSTLYFSPAQSRHPADSRFSTRLFLYNADTQPVDHIDLWLHYPPELIDPQDIDFSAIRGQLAGDPVREVHRGEGFVHVAARFNSPVNQLIQPLLSINWRGLGVAAPAQIMIEPPHDEPVGVFAGRKNIIADSLVGNEGTVAGEVILFSTEPESGDDAPFREVTEGIDPILPDLNHGAGVRLGLLPKSDALLPGEVSTIDVGLINPNVADIDDVRFRLRFDPEAVEILDADENNFITHGVNIYDGGFHKSMPFDMHTRNEVNQAAGTIDYAAGMQGAARGISTGTIARVVFRMKRDAGAATFWFEGLDPLTGRMVSDVRARGRSLLGDAEVRPTEALHNTQVAVAPIK